MAERDSNWPFAPTDGGPGSRPLVVDLENVLVAVVADDAASERAATTLRALGFTDDRLRRYTSAQILAYDETFRSTRGLAGRIVGTVVDDKDSMAQYVTYAGEGGSALWIKVDDRDDANRVVRRLADHDLLYLWYHGPHGVESIRIR